MCFNWSSGWPRRPKDPNFLRRSSALACEPSFARARPESHARLRTCMIVQIPSRTLPALLREEQQNVFVRRVRDSCLKTKNSSLPKRNVQDRMRCHTRVLETVFQTAVSSAHGSSAAGDGAQRRGLVYPARAQLPRLRVRARQLGRDSVSTARGARASRASCTSGIHPTCTDSSTTASPAVVACTDMAPAPSLKPTLLVYATRPACTRPRCHAAVVRRRPG